jgi:uncharacterized protein YggU (UPF0235/DUF167 family)
VQHWSTLRLTVEAHPNATLERVELVDERLRVWVRARAVDGQANEAIEYAMAQALGLRARQVRIVRGARSRQKVVEVDLADLDELRNRLAQFNRG